jgi:hypothetical protein
MPWIGITSGVAADGMGRASVVTGAMIRVLQPHLNSETLRTGILLGGYGRS